ncbi:hypothetical protein [Prescottella agglutinans]|uniref:Peptidase M41 domain-containing protein n=1 Tax=Prescottella agglutinans TaxID=1644129 RepID=A0ABT6MJY0_9NOCA|nr:hypothetical protein [Prescottella agglutinans]MDH6284602.1 hypothetical protein [Prescottella agglutinans]
MPNLTRSRHSPQDRDQLRRSGLRFLEVPAALALGVLLWPLSRSVVAQVGVGNAVTALVVLVLVSGFYRWLVRTLTPARAARSGSTTPVAAAHLAGQKDPTRARLVAEYRDDLLVEHAIARASTTEFSDIRDQIELLKRQDSRTEESNPAERDPDSVERRARHEAAHVVVALATGASICSASVGIRAIGTTSGGYVESVAPLADPADRVWALLRISLAGQVHDLRHGYRDGGSSIDMTNAERHARHLASAGLRPPGFDEELTISALVAAARAEVETILNDHADAVTRIADLLAENADQGRVLRDPDLRPLFESPAGQKTPTP